MKPSKIEWTEAVWNPTIGCDKISEGCKNCYAEVMARRLKGMGNLDYKDGFKFKMLEKRLNEPLKNKKSTLYFVNSMSDLFHKKVDILFLDSIFNIIKQTPHHEYQILTKRAKSMNNYFQNRDIPNNVWLGVTVESSRVKQRIDLIRNLPAKVKWLSCEPLLDNLGKLNLDGIDWVVVGGESGCCARPMKKEWVLNIKYQCDKIKIPFFFKQWGAWGDDGIKRNKKDNGALLNGKIYKKYPKYDKEFKCQPC
ncbi:phage Gp37/Gp68 family protein [Campylobacter fetus subsp. venerealis]|uniref:phage Gp37/Gp68 family protein n=1 Tax=Campylobacter fetus TaxID=196 RepID=UPI0018E8FD50|nr:phage Gp37/Gp68 family protein [Campylobacter fetus]QQF51601.1 phage Gp37/Gp68 family protein [Campylobacter fetus subsp. venerealis]